MDLDIARAMYQELATVRRVETTQECFTHRSAIHLAGVFTLFLRLAIDHRLNTEEVVGAASDRWHSSFKVELEILKESDFLE